MITEDYVSFETAKLLKDKGFDESISMIYTPYGDLRKLHRYESIRNSNYNDITKNYFEYTAPTIQMAMKWLREVHKLHIGVLVTYQHFPKKYEVHIMQLNEINDIVLCPQKDFETYEEACGAAIKYCLENLI